MATVDLPTFASLMGWPEEGSGQTADKAPGAGTSTSATRTALHRRQTRLSPGGLASISEEHPVNSARLPYNRPAATGPQATSQQPAGVIATGTGRQYRPNPSGGSAGASPTEATTTATAVSRPQDQATPVRLHPALDAHVHHYGSEAIGYLLQHAANRGRTGTDAVNWVRRKLPLPVAAAPDSGRSRIGRLKDLISHAVRSHATGTGASVDRTRPDAGPRGVSRVTSEQAAHWNQILEQMETRGAEARKEKTAQREVATAGKGALPPTRPAGAAQTTQPAGYRSAANPRPQDWYSDSAVASRLPTTPAGSRPFTVEEWRLIEQRFDKFRQQQASDAAAKR